jgi:hypothetical protein
MAYPTPPRFSVACHRLTGSGRRALLALSLTAALALALASPAGAATPRRITFWTRCSLDVKVASVEVSPVEVLHLTCARANHAIQRARILLTPAGPIFSTHGYTCRSTNVLPRVDPSPIQLPAAEMCAGSEHRQLAFIWNYVSTGGRLAV